MKNVTFYRRGSLSVILYKSSVYLQFIDCCQPFGLQLGETYDLP